MPSPGGRVGRGDKVEAHGAALGQPSRVPLAGSGRYLACRRPWRLGRRRVGAVTPRRVHGCEGYCACGIVRCSVCMLMRRCLRTAMAKAQGCRVLEASEAGRRCVGATTPRPSRTRSRVIACVVSRVHVSARLPVYGLCRGPHLNVAAPPLQQHDAAPLPQPLAAPPLLLPHDEAA